MIGRLYRLNRQLKAKGVMGINRRNSGYVLNYNKRHLYPVVDDKLATKQKAAERNIPVPPLYGVIRNEHDIYRELLDILGDHESFVVKPAHGAGGEGIIVVGRKVKDMYRTVSGKLLSLGDIEHHISSTLSGLYSLGGVRDQAMIEYKVNADPIFSDISFQGVPDVRIICLFGYPVMAMVRLPTMMSDGKANLHQGAIGVGIDLATGRTLRGTWRNQIVDTHPDTFNPVEGIQIPDWVNFMTLAASCYELSGLGYIGVDIVMDKDLGPLILELNARPGLNIQIANDAGLYTRCQMIESLKERQDDPGDRVAFSQEKFA
jgi:alpha-L-glutamate ligase-like protein